MKQTTIFIVLLMFALLSLSGQENNYSPCYNDNMREGNKAYEQGRYKEAKTYYETAKQCNGGNPSIAQQKINSCDEKIRAQIEAAKAKRKAEEAAEAKRKAEEAARQQAMAKAKARGYEDFTINDITFRMIYVEGGTFTMGCTSEQVGDCNDDEKPIHSVTLSDYFIGETEVTQALWEAVMGTTIWQQRDKINPKLFVLGEGASYPMYYVSWDEAVELCKKLNEKFQSQLPLGYRFALPTEAQWEYAARGGNKSQHYKYTGNKSIGEVALYLRNFGGYVYPVKGKQANELGLYDMSGNVREWCSDWYDRSYYSSSAQTNPTGPYSGLSRVCRGGSWFDDAENCRVSYRVGGPPYIRDEFTGFRLALVYE